MSLLVQTFSLLRNNKGEPPSINNGGGSRPPVNIHPPSLLYPLSLSPAPNFLSSRTSFKTPPSNLNFVTLSLFGKITLKKINIYAIQPEDKINKTQVILLCRAVSSEEGSLVQSPGPSTLGMKICFLAS